MRDERAEGERWLKLLHGMALLYALFLVLCVIGRRSWAASLARPVE